jgi:hypothetical protein
LPPAARLKACQAKGMAAIAAPTWHRVIRISALFILTSSGSMGELSRTHSGIVNPFTATIPEPSS